MAYAEIIRIPKVGCFDFGLRERLRCEYRKNPHPLRPDFPPDLILRDHSPPDLILKDEITGEFWELVFGTEIEIKPAIFEIAFRTGIQIDNLWGLRMRNGEIVVSTEPLGGEWVSGTHPQAPFILAVVNGELVYTEKAKVVPNDFFNIAWRFFFGEEITVLPWQSVSPMTGVMLDNDWSLRMELGEIIIEKNFPLLVPFIREKPGRWKFQLNMVGQEMVYVPFYEAQPY